MNIQLQIIRRCAIALGLVHLVILASYFVPYLADPLVSLWQVLLPPGNSLFAFSRAPLIIIICIMFVPWAFPLFAAWATWRFPFRIMSLVNIRLSLPLLFVSWFFWSVLALELYVPASGFLGLLRLALFIPVFGTLASWCLCFLLARYLCAFQLEESMQPVSHSSTEEQVASEDLEPEISDSPEQVIHRWPFFRLIALGLLCQVVVVVSLFLPFTDAYNPYSGHTERITGWQTLGLTFPLGFLSLLLFVLPLLPIIVALLYRVPLLSRNIQREVFHRGGVYLSYWLTLMCFVLSGIILEYALLFIGADASKTIRWMDVAFGIPGVAFFLALFCSGTLRVFLWRSAQPSPG